MSSNDPASTNYSSEGTGTTAAIPQQHEGASAAAALTSFSQQPGGPPMHPQPQPLQQQAGKSSSPPPVVSAQPPFYQQQPQFNPHTAVPFGQQAQPYAHPQQSPPPQQIYGQPPQPALQYHQQQQPPPQYQQGYQPQQPYQQQAYPQQMQPPQMMQPGQPPMQPMQMQAPHPGQQHQQPQQQMQMQGGGGGAGYQLHQIQPHPGAGFVSPPQAPGQCYSYAQGPSPAVGLPPAQQFALQTHNLTSPPYTGQRPSAYPPGFCVRVLQAQAHTNPFGKRLQNDIPLFLVCVFENEALGNTPGITPELALHCRWKRFSEFEDLHKLMPLGVGKLPEFPSVSNRLSGWLTKKADDPAFLTQRLMELDKYMHAAVGFYHALMPPHLRPWFIHWLNRHIGLGPVEHLTQNALEFSADPSNQWPEDDAVSSIGKGLKQSFLNLVEARAPRRKLTYQEEIVRVMQKQREYDLAYLDALPLQQRPQAVRARDLMGRMQGVEAWFSLPDPVAAAAGSGVVGAAGAALGAAASAVQAVAAGSLPQQKLPALKDRWIFLGGMIERKLDNVGLHPSGGFVQSRSAFYLVSEPLLYRDQRTGEEFLEVQLTHWMHQRPQNDQPGVFSVRIFPPASAPVAASPSAAPGAAAARPAARQARIEFVGARGAGFFCGIDLGANVVTAAEMKMIQENAGSAPFRALQQQGHILSRTFTDVRPAGF